MLDFLVFFLRLIRKKSERPMPVSWRVKRKRFWCMLEMKKMKNVSKMRIALGVHKFDIFHRDVEGDR